MAEFQTVVNIMPAAGMPGQQVSINAAYTAYNYVSDGTLTAGTFAFADPADAANGMPQLAHSKVASNGRLLGFVQRVHSGVVNVPFASGTNVYTEGQSVTIAVRGQFYMAVPDSGTATEGQSVLCDPTTGATTNDTGWVVHLLQGETSAGEGDLVIIEHYGLQAAPAAGA